MSKMKLFQRTKPNFLSREDCDKVVAAIREVEKQTTGELRVFMESHCGYVDAMDRAKEIFTKLKMTRTERRNAVLVYLAFNDKQFAIFGDEEIYTKAGGEAFWKNAAAHLLEHLQQSRVTEGIVACIEELGLQLKTHFPFDPTITKNELPDEIVFGK